MNPFNINSYNVDIAKSLGPLSSIYISYIDSCIRRNNGENKISLSREQIRDEIGFDENNQSNVESYMQSIGLLDVKSLRGSSDKNYYILNYNNINNLLNIKENTVVSSEFIVNQPKKSKEISKEDKRTKNINRLKKSVVCDDEVLKTYIYQWIEAMVDSKKVITPASVVVNVGDLLAASKSQEDLINIVKMSIRCVWKDFTWAIQKIMNEKTASNNSFVQYSSIKSDKTNEVNETF